MSKIDWQVPATSLAGEKTGDQHNNNRHADLWLRLKGYRLTTAEILYHMPDHPGVLQSFVWQKHDLAPKFPELNKFLDFWRREIDGPLHSVKVAVSALVADQDLRYYDHGFSLQ